jgi:hypothetical protein
MEQGVINMPEFDQLIYLGFYALLAVLALVQLFLALRPGFVWGLLMPVLFAAFWVVVVKQPRFIPLPLELNPAAIELYNYFALLCLGASLGLYIICRLGKLLRSRYRDKQRQARLEAKQLRQQQESALASQKD